MANTPLDRSRFLVNTGRSSNGVNVKIVGGRIYANLGPTPVEPTAPCIQNAISFECSENSQYIPVI